MEIYMEIFLLTYCNFGFVEEYVMGNIIEI